MAEVTTTRDDVIAIAPELAAVPAGEPWDAVLGFVQVEVNVDSWGGLPRANRAARYLVAHLLTMTQEEGSDYPIQMEKVGDVSRSYAVPTSFGDGDLDNTSYGREYQRLLRQIVARWVVL